MKIFTIEHKIYFNETNAVGGVAYFSNYVKWQGMAREEYFIQSVPSWREIMREVSLGKVNMITAEEHSHFIQHAYFGDSVIITLQTVNLKKFSFDMIFKMYRNSKDNLIYDGWQKLAFDDYKGNFIPVPDAMRKSVVEYMMPDNEYNLLKKRYATRDKIYQEKLLGASK